jgi:hypothetical protein
MPNHSTGFALATHQVHPCLQTAKLGCFLEGCSHASPGKHSHLRVQCAAEEQVPAGDQQQHVNTGCCCCHIPQAQVPMPRAVPQETTTSRPQVHAGRTPACRLLTTACWRSAAAIVSQRAARCGSSWSCAVRSANGLPAAMGAVGTHLLLMLPYAAAACRFLMPLAAACCWQ